MQYNITIISIVMFFFPLPASEYSPVWQGNNEAVARLFTVRLISRRSGAGNLPGQCVAYCRFPWLTGREYGIIVDKAERA